MRDKPNIRPEKIVQAFKRIVHLNSDDLVAQAERLADRGVRWGMAGQADLEADFLDEQEGENA